MARHKKGMCMADVKLYISTDKIWGHFFENVDRLLDNEDCVAESKQNRTSLYITANGIFPQLVLYADDKAMFSHTIATKDECSNWAVYLITRYVAGVQTEGTPEKKEDKPKIIDLPMRKEENPEPVDVPADDYDEDEEEQHILDTIYEREDELTQSMGDFLAVVLCEDDFSAVKEVYGEKFINECVDDFLQYLSDQHNVSIYRPTLETDPETGCEVLKEYPYGWDKDYEGKE